VEKRRFTSVIIAISLLLLGSFAVNAEVKVTVNDCEGKQSVVQYETKVSLFQVMNSIGLDKCSYYLGSSLLNGSMKQNQLQQKQALLLAVNQLLANAENERDIEYFSRLQRLVESQSVTGRVLGLDFEPFHVEILPLKNRILTENSILNLVNQPSMIQLIGFSQSQHRFDSDQSIGDIYNQYDICKSCKNGWLWLIQPNGAIEKRKVGYWTNEKFYLAPGGWLMSPLESSVFDEIAPNFNQMLADWLATQVVR
jgi:hypothetical protein